MSDNSPQSNMASDEELNISASRSAQRRRQSGHAVVIVDDSSSDADHVSAFGSPGPSHSSNALVFDDESDEEQAANQSQKSKRTPPSKGRKSHHSSSKADRGAKNYEFDDENEEPERVRPTKRQAKVKRHPDSDFIVSDSAESSEVEIEHQVKSVKQPRVYGKSGRAYRPGSPTESEEEDYEYSDEDAPLEVQQLWCGMCSEWFHPDSFSVKQQKEPHERYCLRHTSTSCFGRTFTRPPPPAPSESSSQSDDEADDYEGTLLLPESQRKRKPAAERKLRRGSSRRKTDHIYQDLHESESEASSQHDEEHDDEHDAEHNSELNVSNSSARRARIIDDDADDAQNTSRRSNVIESSDEDVGSSARKNGRRSVDDDDVHPAILMQSKQIAREAREMLSPGSGSDQHFNVYVQYLLMDMLDARTKRTHAMPLSLESPNASSFVRALSSPNAREAQRQAALHRAPPQLLLDPDDPELPYFQTARNRCERKIADLRQALVSDQWDADLRFALDSFPNWETKLLTSSTGTSCHACNRERSMMWRVTLSLPFPDAASLWSTDCSASQSVQREFVLGKLCHVRLWIYHMLMHFKVQLVGALSKVLPVSSDKPELVEFVDQFLDTHVALVNDWRQRLVRMQETAASVVALMGQSNVAGGAEAVLTKLRGLQFDMFSVNPLA